ncbi:ATP-binding cassette sub-family A member 3 [Operophtera brumata]|uniref:ATP-binding cassette sub-family A member 3 n=1 Tax=Operophtera brumata TaxID=104452 RepID=A0A0L7LQY9_OPEBR|nr:ATP-binding cassette sub-family A member 3 [Operophtera brumata]
MIGKLIGTFAMARKTGTLAFSPENALTRNVTIDAMAIVAEDNLSFLFFFIDKDLLPQPKGYKNAQEMENALTQPNAMNNILVGIEYDDNMARIIKNKSGKAVTTKVYLQRLPQIAYRDDQLLVALERFISMIIMLTAAGDGYAVLTFTHWSVLLFILVLYVIASLSFSFMVSVFFSRANTAASFMGLAWFSTYSVFMLTQVLYEDISWTSKLLFSLISNTAMGYAFQMIIMCEGTSRVGRVLHPDILPRPVPTGSRGADAAAGLRAVHASRDVRREDTARPLWGMVPPTSGSATINGYSIVTETEQARKSLGICPQHNVLFPDLTVAEHIIFYSRLKGVPAKKKRDEVNHFRDVVSANLSGGQKRRLSVAAAMCGDSRVVLLDEPTSGLDPAARRALWDLLQKEKKGRTMILTTHFMDEADILGDRIAIMSGGRLQCVGTPYFLKKHYGMGYKLTIVKTEHCSELTYILPNESVSRFPDMLKEFEEKRGSLNVASYGLSITSLEEVFMKNHIKAMFLKLAYNTMRNKLTAFIQFVSPVINITLSVIISRSWKFMSQLPPLELSLESGFRTTQTLISQSADVADGSLEAKTMMAYKDHFKTNYGYHDSAISLALVNNAILGALSPGSSMKFINHPLPYSIENLERISGAKLLQRVSGVRPAVLWVSALAWDWLWLLLVYICIVITLACFQESSLSTPNELAIIPIHYLASFYFEASATGFSKMCFMNIFTVQSFWQRWRMEYLHGLQVRQKWNTLSTPITPGVVVVVIEDNVPSLVWLLAIVDKPEEDEDSDVYSERARIKAMTRTELAQRSLVCRDLSKFYGHFLAVNRLTLGVERGECFGLLGINGAGKTSTFRYCPQFDALFDNLTARETLRIFCLLRGIPSRIGAASSMQLANELGFAKHFDKKPTTGMDPASKRLVWSSISAAARSGRSVVLTSHSMEECEALCSRLTVMVSGRLHCLGPLQHLKTKFSQGNYSILVWSLISAAARSGRSVVLTSHSMEECEALCSRLTVMVSGRLHCLGPLQHLKTKFSQGNYSRLVWSSISAAARSGRSVVLTSHSMEECEALCSRLTVMVSGRLHCLGPLQHLKTKFSQGNYSRFVWSLISAAARSGRSVVLTSHSMEECEALCSRLHPHCEVPVWTRQRHAFIKYQQLRINTYYLNDAELPWWRVFHVMEKARDLFPIEDYAVSQTTLEQVFLRFTRIHAHQD